MGCASRHREPEGRVRGIHLGWMGVGERGVGCGGGRSDRDGRVQIPALDNARSCGARPTNRRRDVEIYGAAPAVLA